jgi:23S rRNA (cytidine1920-2'-O)/16S rRNA (cytidine1409-2'-O)-methyltransferase
VAGCAYPPPVPRLDVVVCERGLAESRSRAQALIMAGRVTVDGAPATKAGMPVRPEAQVAVSEPARYVSRGGEKLESALTAFDVRVAGERCLDIGASTGGFTDCLLQAGAASVIALDVGHAQLHERIRGDERVTVVEGVNARALDPASLPYAASVCAIDVSFISLALILPAAVPCLMRPATVLPLVKPQFEAGRQDARRGVVRDPQVHLSVLRRIAAIAGEAGLLVLDAAPSGLTGPSGNREFFLHLVTPDHPDAARAPADHDQLLVRAAA